MLLFLYGTLMKGMNNSEMIRHEKCLGRGITKHQYSLHVSGSVPFLHDDEKLYQVSGEVYEIGTEILETLDILEANGEWYERKNVDILMGAKIVKCQAYFNNEKGVLLEHGSFRDYVDEMTRAFYRE